MKVLLLSHNPVSTYNAMGKTLLAFLDAFHKEEVCQLYIYPTYPSADVCSSFYRITDRDVLKSFCSFRLPGGSVESTHIGQTAPGYESAWDAKLYGSPRNRSPLVRLAREALWRMSHWFHRDLKQWIRQEKPDCILFAGGDGMFLYDMALQISRTYSLPIVTYLCDECYFLPPEKGLAEWLRQALLKRKIETVLKNSAHLIVISPEMEAAYRSCFPIPVTTIMTGSSREIAESASIREEVTVLTYMGNLGYGRYHTLAKLGHALDTRNRKNDTQIRLDIYSAQQLPEALAVFSQLHSIRFLGFISGTEVDQVMQRTDLIVHVEDFDRRNIALVKHSVSTKIADSLASGIPVLAYGPAQVSSMRHLTRYDCAFTAWDEVSLEKALQGALSHRRRRETVAENALKTARIYHSRNENSRKLKAILTDSCTENTRYRTRHKGDTNETTG